MVGIKKDRKANAWRKVEESLGYVFCYNVFKNMQEKQKKSLFRARIQRKGRGGGMTPLLCKARILL